MAEAVGSGAGTVYRYRGAEQDCFGHPLASGAVFACGYKTSDASGHLGFSTGDDGGVLVWGIAPTGVKEIAVETAGGKQVVTVEADGAVAQTVKGEPKAFSWTNEAGQIQRSVVNAT